MKTESQIIKEAYKTISTTLVKSPKEEGRKQQYVGDFSIEEAVGNLLGINEENDMMKKVKEMLGNPDMNEAEEFLKGCMVMKEIDEKCATKIEKLYELCKKDK